MDILKFDSAWHNLGFQDEFSCYFCGAPDFNFSDYLIRNRLSDITGWHGSDCAEVPENGEGGDQSILCTPTKQTYYVTVFLSSVNVNTFLLAVWSKL